MVIALVFISLLIIACVIVKKRIDLGLTGKLRENDLTGEGVIHMDGSLGIVAKPDLLVGTKVIEVKSASVSKPYAGDVLQLAATALVTNAKKGELRYPNRSFRLEDPSRFRPLIEKIATRMRFHLKYRVPPPAAPSPGKCRKCMFRDICEEAL